MYSSHLLLSVADSGLDSHKTNQLNKQTEKHKTPPYFPMTTLNVSQKKEKKTQINPKLLSWKAKSKQIKYDKNAVYGFVAILKEEKLKQGGEMTCLRSQTISLMIELRKGARLFIL